MSVRAMPDVNVKRDALDYFQASTTFILLGIAICQLWLLSGTLKATRVAADAAKQSAETAARDMLLTHRPVVDIDGLGEE